jgi:3-dehydroquinate synthase
MQTINIKTNSGESNIYLGGKLENVKAYLPANKKVVVITDEHILRHYSQFLKEFPVVMIGLGEKNKNLQTIETIFSEFVRLEVDRSSFILAVGGGIVCDVAGFAASTFMRGLPFGFVSTTLLSQVDASVGGKNGVNFQGYKNMVGVFMQPEFVICDVSMFQTLDKNEFVSGFAEIIKAAAIRNMELFEYLEANIEKALKYDTEVLEKVIYESVLIKARVVQNDEKEKGERRILNFGHTFAHSIEKNTGMLHGEAVSIGMVLASRASVKLGLLQEQEALRMEALLKKYGLPVKLNLEKNKVYDALLKDKKREGDNIHLVLLNGLGNALVQKVPIIQMEEIINDLY